MEIGNDGGEIVCRELEVSVSLDGKEIMTRRFDLMEMSAEDVSRIPFSVRSHKEICMHNRWCSQLLFMRCLCLFIYLEQQEIDWWRPGHHINYVCNIEAIEVWLTLRQPWPSLILKEMVICHELLTKINDAKVKQTWIIGFWYD